MAIKARYFILAVLGALLLGAGITFALDRVPSGSLAQRLRDVSGQLESTQSALDAAGKRCDELVARLDTTKGIADEATAQVGRDIDAAGRIAETGQRLIFVSKAIRRVIENIRRIIESSTLPTEYRALVLESRNGAGIDSSGVGVGNSGG